MREMPENDEQQQTENIRSLFLRHRASRSTRSIFCASLTTYFLPPTGHRIGVVASHPPAPAETVVGPARNSGLAIEHRCHRLLSKAGGRCEPASYALATVTVVVTTEMEE